MRDFSRFLVSLSMKMTLFCIVFLLLIAARFGASPSQGAPPRIVVSSESPFPASPKPRMRGEQISTELVTALVNNFARTIHRIDEGLAFVGMPVNSLLSKGGMQASDRQPQIATAEKKLAFGSRSEP